MVHRRLPGAAWSEWLTLLLLAILPGLSAKAVDNPSEPTTVAVSTTSSVPAAAHSTSASRPLWRQIDEIVAGNHRGPVAPKIDDATFIRRVTLDLIGRSPTAEEARAFLEEAATEAQTAADDATVSDRREKLIDSLLARPEFAEHFASVLDVMIMERRADKYIPTGEWRGFLRQWLADNRPLDELCREILAADGTGDTLRPAAKFYLDRGVEANLVTRDVGRVFFGRNVQCAQCHDHPIVGDYKQAEYYGILAFLNRSFLFEDAQQGNQAFLGEKADGKLEFASVFVPEAGSTVAKPVLPDAMGMDVEPHFMEDAEAYLVAPAKGVRSVPRFSLRQQLAVLATHPKSQAFSRNLANRIWAYMLSVGVVHPVDLHHADNPPVSAELLHLLTDHCVSLRYDLRAILKQIALSETYQRSVSLPEHEKWDGPAFDPEAIRAEINQIAERLERLLVNEKALGEEMQHAQQAVSDAHADVAVVQKEIDAEQKVYRTLMESRDLQQKTYNDLQAKRKAQQEIAAALQAAALQSEKAAKQLPDDKELAASHALVAQRAAADAEAVKAVEAELEKAKEALAAAATQVDARRSRLAGLGSRTVALGEFVTEARGVLRVLQVRHQRLIDQQGDWQRQKRLAEQRLLFVDLRGQIQKAGDSADQTVMDELRKKMTYAAEYLQQEWVREYAARPTRGLSPEQLGNATFTALGGEHRARVAAMKDWEEKNKENPQLLADTTAREAHVLATVEGARTSFQGEFVDRYALPGGTPQDAFFAAADQALFMLNDSAVQEWLKPTEGSLIHRLQGIADAGELTSAMYWSVFSRPPDEEESVAIREYLAVRGDGRLAAIQELVWGMLASAELRFMP